MKRFIPFFAWLALLAPVQGLLAQYKVMIDQSVLRQEGRLNMNGFVKSAPGIGTNLFEKTNAPLLSKAELNQQNGKAVIRLELNPDNTAPLNRNAFKAMVLKGRLETKVVENEQVVDKVTPISLQVRYSPSGKGQRISDQKIVGTQVLASRLLVDSLIVTDSANLLHVVRKVGFSDNLMGDHQIDFQRFMDFELMMDVIGQGRGLSDGRISGLLAPSIRICEESMQLNVNFPQVTNIEWATHVELAWNFTDNYGTDNSERINFAKNSGSVILPITETSYTIPLVFEKGWFSCRLRCLNRGSEVGIVQQSAWSNVAKTKIERGLIHEADYMNWQAITEFGEDGKRKDIVTYLDGTMRSRQAVTQTRTQSGVDVIVAETIYDHEGRPAIQTMAAPVLKIPTFYTERNLNPPPPGQGPNPEVTQRILEANERIRNATGRGTTTPGSGILITPGMEIIAQNQSILFGNLIAPEPSVQIPCPIGQAPLRYYPLFNVDSSGKAFSHKVFDPPGANRCAIIQAPKMNSNSGAAFYYSTENPQKDGHEAYLPHAEGYPYTRQVFTADKTNRLLSTNLPGPVFKTGRGHDNRFFYSTPGQQELDMFLGNNAGIANFYQRVDMVDPNGQSRFEIKDELGKTVISGLTGSKSTSILDTIKEGFSKKITYSVANSPADVVDRENGTRSVTDKFKIDNDRSRVILDYTLNHNKLSETLCTENICFDCVYNLVITLSNDACGTIEKEIRHKKVRFRQAPYNGAINLVCESGSPIDTSFSLDLTLNRGTYTISRKLTVNQEVMDGYLTQIATRPLCSDITCQYRAISELVVDSNACHGTQCGDPSTWRRRYTINKIGQGANSRVTYTPKQTHTCLPYGPAELTDQQQREIERFNEEAEAKRCQTSLAPCEAELSLMLGDLSPEGQYAETRPKETSEDENYTLAGTTAQGEFAPPAFSIFSNRSILPNGTNAEPEPYKRPRKNRFNPKGDAYYEEDGSTPSWVYLSEEEKEQIAPPARERLVFNAENGGYAINPKDLPASLFIKYWKNSWAKALLPYHPEFLRLVWCEVYAKPSAEFLENFEKSTYLNREDFQVIPGLGPAEKDKIYTLDPYFNAPINFAFASEARKNELKSYTENELEKAVLQLQYCNNLASDADLRACLNGRRQGQYESMKEEEWKTLKAFYLTKRKIMQEEAAIKAVKDAVEGFVGQALTSGSVMKGDAYLAFKRKDLPSGNVTVREYWKGRALRFYDSENAANQCIDRADARLTYQPNISDNCNQREATPSCNQGCASQAYFQNWLNRLLSSNTLIGSRPAQLTKNIDLVQEPFLQKAGLRPPTMQVVWKGAVSTSGDLEGHFWTYKLNEIPASNNGNEVKDGQAQFYDGQAPFYVNLIKPAINGFTWNSVLMISCITVTNNANPYRFTLTVLLNTGATVQISGTTNVFNLQNCQPQTCTNLYSIIRFGNQGSGTNFGNLFNGGSRAGGQTVRYRKVENLQVGNWSGNPVSNPEFLANQVVGEKSKNAVCISFVGNPPANTSYAGQREPLYTANVPAAVPLDGEYMFHFGFTVKGEIDWQLLLRSQVKDQNGQIMPMPLQFIAPMPVSQEDINLGQRHYALSILLKPQSVGGTTKYPRKVELFVQYPDYNINNADSRGNPISWLELRTASLSKTNCQSCCRQMLENKPPPPRDCKKEFENVVLENELELRTRHVNSLIARFKTAYLNQCLKSTDVLNVSYQKQWYMVTISQYDLAGNLIATVPPKGVSVLTDEQLTNVNLSRDNASGGTFPNHSMVSEYRFNTQNQPVQIKTPDAGISKVWYNLMGQVVMSQNAVQLNQNAISYVRYDGLGRPVEEGEIKSAGNLLSMGNSFGLVTSRFLWQNALVSNPVQAAKSHVAFTQYDRPRAPVNYFAGGQKNLRGRVAARWMKGTFNGPVSHSMYYSYDILGYVADYVTENNTLPARFSVERYKTFHYEFDLFSGHPTRVAYQAGKADAFYHHFVYDTDNRIRASQTSLDGYIDNAGTDSYLTYYRNGQPARMEIGGGLQGIDFAFTLQGWPKFINIPGQDLGGDAAAGRPDVFSENLQYFNGDYKAIGASIREESVGKNLYTGLLTSTLQAYKKEGFSAIQNQYRYDQSSRLTGHARGADGFDYRFSSGFAYDPNGNMTSLKRKGTGSGFIDNLQFSYTSNQNRLSAVTDDATHPDESTIGDLKKGTHSFDYDENGNLIKDDEGKYSWHHFGKIKEFQATGTGPTVNYFYDANRRRVGKQVQNGTETTNTWYVLDPNGQLAALYTYNAAEAPKPVFAPIYSVKRLGIYRYPAEKPVTIRPEDKQYEIHNHLGDVVAIVEGRVSTPGDGEAELTVSNLTEYYPYGMPMPTLAASDYRFGFNGMEKDRNGEYTTEYRQYDARMGRWKSVDPVVKESFSPFLSFANNPINFIDLLGDDEIGFGSIKLSELRAQVHTDLMVNNSTYRHNQGIIREFQSMDSRHRNNSLEARARITAVMAQNATIFDNELAENLIVLSRNNVGIIDDEGATVDLPSTGQAQEVEEGLTIMTGPIFGATAYAVQTNHGVAHSVAFTRANAINALVEGAGSMTSAIDAGRALRQGYSVEFVAGSPERGERLGERHSTANAPTRHENTRGESLTLQPRVIPSPREPASTPASTSSSSRSSSRSQIELRRGTAERSQTSRERTRVRQVNRDFESRQERPARR